VIEFDDNDGSFGSSSSTIAGATLPAAGTYYLQVRHFSATSPLRPYNLYPAAQRHADARDRTQRRGSSAAGRGLGERRH
jgi:hypothetical protein